MKRLMEEAATQHIEAIHYSASVGICVGGKATNTDINPGFWLMVLETFSEKRLKKEEVDHTEKRVRDVTGWSDPVDESTGFGEAACQN